MLEKDLAFSFHFEPSEVRENRIEVLVKCYTQESNCERIIKSVSSSWDKLTPVTEERNQAGLQFFILLGVL